MDLAMASFSALPQWQGLDLGQIRLREAEGSWLVPFKATSQLGATPGYSSAADAVAAARRLSAGAALAAVAVTGDSGVFRVWRLDLNDRASFGHGRSYPFAFERGLPVDLGKGVSLHPGPVVDAVAGLIAVVDGRATLPLR